MGKDKFASRVFFPFNLFLVVIFSLFLTGGFAAPEQIRAAGGLEGWRDTGLDLPAEGRGICIDATQPNLFIFGDTDGTYSFNWSSGVKQKLNNASLLYCNQFNGLFYGEENGKPVYFSTTHPQPQPTKYLPGYLSEDSSLLSYSFDNAGKLWVTTDGGSTWLARNNPTGIMSLTIASADAHVIYAFTREEGSDNKKLKYAVYRSQDTGQTWQKGYSGEANGNSYQPTASLSCIAGRSTPIGLLRLDANNGSSGSSGHTTTLISSDGGITFQLLAESGMGGGLNSLFYSNDGLVIKYFTGFSISHDGGVTRQALTQPYDFNTPSGSTAHVEFAQSAPANLFSSDGSKLYYSADNAHTWQVIAAAPQSYLFSPYAPLALVGLVGQRVYVLELKDSAKTETRAVAATQAPGSTYFPETSHNLRGIFKAYWEKNGGLAQFGYPKTEEFREFNPADGKIYLVQYFERNRFEYHPENTGNQYEVLLGLLGNQLTAERRATGEGAFNRFDNANYPGGLYFPETGHNLRNSFKTYWEQNGGLSLYGYPISEEFYELNPDDGKTYVVQYFERNRFEYHPENKGTKYEVLLGLLGNSLLKQKGWL
ncbi:MAG: sialidase family protein [Chloroflexota bacterium]